MFCRHGQIDAAANDFGEGVDELLVKLDAFLANGSGCCALALIAAQIDHFIQVRVFSKGFLGAFIQEAPLNAGGLGLRWLVER